MTVNAHLARRARIGPLLATLALLALALLGCNRGLWTPDEPREAEIGREMALAPAVIPRLDGHPFIEKPPLYYWVMAGAYRLSGGFSPWAARAVSVAAALATLAALYRWAARACSPEAALTVVLMLATSLEFLVASHWILLDPLLMLTTTLAAGAAWCLLSGPPDPSRERRLRGALYAALTLALWIKGPIGPLLIAAGLLCYLLIERPVNGWRRLRPIGGAAWLLLMFALLAWAIARQGGGGALHEWLYVNQLQRLLHPGATGHRQPWLYYTWTAPYTLLPWVPAALLALLAEWRARHAAGAAVRAAGRGASLARYGALMCAGMLLLLSLSETKRETYLLPALPWAFVWIGIRCHALWLQRAAAPATSRLERALWVAQLLLIALLLPLAPLAAWIWLGRASLAILAALVPALLGLAALLWIARRRPGQLGPATLAAAMLAAAVLLGLAGPVLDRTKDLAPFMRAMARRLPAGHTLYAENADETLLAEVPFYTGRTLLELDRQRLPPWILIQSTGNGQDAPLPDNYQQLMRQSFGAGRSLALWHAAGATLR